MYKQLLLLTVLAAAYHLGAGQSKYYILTESQSFIGSMIGCKTVGMKLATISTQADLNLTISAVNGTTYHPSGYWIGGAMSESSNGFYWVEDGLKIAYTAWGTGQPIYGNDKPYCIRVGNSYKTNEPYTWESIDCNTECYAICEEV